MNDTNINALLNRVVEILPQADRDYEWNVNSGMRGRVVAIELHVEDIAKLVLDLSEFVDYNQSRMHYNFYDKNGNPTLNAYQAGMIREDNIDTLYIDTSTSPETWLKILV